jgi:hypothetical protein
MSSLLLFGQESLPFSGRQDLDCDPRGLVESFALRTAPLPLGSATLASGAAGAHGGQPRSHHRRLQLGVIRGRGSDVDKENTTIVSGAGKLSGAKEAAMKVATFVLATAFALTSTLAFAQTTGTEGYGSVVQPSVGSYAWPPVGSALAVPTWRNTGPAAPPPNSPAFSLIPAPTPTVRASGARR